MNSLSTPPAPDPKETGNSANRPIGNFLIKIEEVPAEVRDYAINKLSPKDANGNSIKDKQGKDVRAGISTARENGSYYGPVILNNDKFIVQAVGKDRSYAVVHPKEKVKLQGSTLTMLDSKKQLNGFNVQVHYSEGQAKAYPYKPKETILDETSKVNEKAIIKPEYLIAKAQEYAVSNIKHAGQRAAFLKHMEKVTQQAFQQEQNAKPHQSLQQATQDTHQRRAKTDTNIER